MRVGLHSLLKGAHLLDFEKLASPLLVKCPTLIFLHLQLIQHSLFLLFQHIDFFLELLNFFIGLFILFTL